MRLSLAYEMQRPAVDDHAGVEETLEQCVLADRMGFDAIWFVEHHFLNDQWLSATMAFCDRDNAAARELAAKSLRTFFGPDRPYLKDQTHLYEQLVESWGGVPEHLRANFARYLKTEGTEGAPEVDLSGGSGQIASALWNQIDADTLVDRGVLVAGDPESCLRSIAIHEQAGVDELQFLMATETVPHDRVMSSIEMFGAHVIPELRKRRSAAARA